MGGIKALFQFKSYKIDHIKLEMAKSVGLLSSSEDFNQKKWEFSVGIREPTFIEKINSYIGGINIILALKNPEDDSSNYLDLELGMAGIFNIEERLSQETEEKFIKLNIPTILLPYARAAITAILANSGFGSVVLPLINIQHIFEKNSDKINIKVISD